jgi:hypothetical protein
MPKSSYAIACERRHERHRLIISPGARVEIEIDGHGRLDFELLDISAGGVCFGLEEGSPRLEPGAELGSAVLYVQDEEIRGTLTVAHMTGGGFAGTLCGASFEPTSESDARRLAAVLKRLEQLSTASHAE